MISLIAKIATLFSIQIRVRIAGYVRQADIDDYAELIPNVAKHSDYVSNADVVQLLHVSSGKAYRLLKGLVNSGSLRAVNKGHYAKYQII